ncbi:hypothetical protein J6590_052398 [Homalodisca vitripennis]|nr:hypothetical protein J6590_052398 [Homalodisca vitripennis]
MTLSALSRADPVRRTHWTGIVTLPGVTLFHERHRSRVSTGVEIRELFQYECFININDSPPPRDPDFEVIECQACTGDQEAKICVVDPAGHQVTFDGWILIGRSDYDLVDSKFVVVTGVEVKDYSTSVEVVV